MKLLKTWSSFNSSTNFIFQFGNTPKAQPRKSFEPKPEGEIPQEAKTPPKYVAPPEPEPADPVFESDSLRGVSRASLTENTNIELKLGIDQLLTENGGNELKNYQKKLAIYILVDEIFGGLGLKESENVELPSSEDVKIVVGKVKSLREQQCKRRTTARKIGDGGRKKAILALYSPSNTEKIVEKTIQEPRKNKKHKKGLASFFKGLFKKMFRKREGNPVSSIEKQKETPFVSEIEESVSGLSGRKRDLVIIMIVDLIYENPLKEKFPDTEEIDAIIVKVAELEDKQIEYNIQTKKIGNGPRKKAILEHYGLTARQERVK